MSAVASWLRDFRNDVASLEGRATLLFCLRLFLIMFAYYLLKPVREELIASADARSYAMAIQAALLIVLVPLFSEMIRRVHGNSMFRLVSLFLATNILLFFVAGKSAGGYNGEIGSVYYVWLGLFSVIMLTLFWAMVSDYHCVEKGKRLMTYIAIGGSGGAVLGSAIAMSWFNMIGAYGMMLVATLILVLVALIPPPDPSLHRDGHEQEKDTARHLLGGLKRVVDVPYLRWVAALVALLSLVNSVGEVVLFEFVVEAYGDEGRGQFYSTFYFYVNIATLLLQAFIVRPLYRVIGVGGVLIALVAINLVMYASALLVPLLFWFAIVKMVDNSVDYSVTNTTKQILLLPLDRFTRYDGMLAINTLFYRFGDLIQLAIVWLVVRYFEGSPLYLIAINSLFCLILIGVAVKISSKFKRRSREAAQFGSARL